ncbi:hypothetical protein GCM10009678_37150 [Actinomadura kijaniata]
MVAPVLSDVMGSGIRSGFRERRGPMVGIGVSEALILLVALGAAAALVVAITLATRRR